MKKSIFIPVVLVLMSCVFHSLFGQESITKQKTKSNNTNERTSSTNQVDCVVRISPTENGCSIVFENTIVSPRDAASGLPTGKRTHKPVRFTISLNDNTIVEVTSSSVMTSIGTKSNTTTPEPSNSPGNPIKGISVKGGRHPGGGKEFDNIVVTNGEFSLPAGLTNGEYEMSVSFNYEKIKWENNDKGNSKSYVSGRFILDIDGGVCRSIKEKGVSVKSTR